MNVYTQVGTNTEVVVLMNVYTKPRVLRAGDGIRRIYE